MNNYILSEAERDEIFSSIILPKFIYSLIPQDNPEAHILGGQPGAGKSHFIRVLKNDPENKNSLIVNGDDLRGYHPFYYQLLENDEKNAADLVQKDVNHWVERLIQEISDRKGSMIIEGTMRNPNVPLETAAMLNEKMYSVILHVILVNPEISRADIFLRYELQKKLTGVARYTKIEAHENTIDNLTNSIIVINRSKQIKHIKLYRRKTIDYDMLYEIKREGDPTKDSEMDLIDFLEQEKNRQITIEEQEYAKKAWEEIFSLSERRNASQDYLRELSEYYGKCSSGEYSRKLR